MKRGVLSRWSGHLKERSIGHSWNSFGIREQDAVVHIFAVRVHCTMTTAAVHRWRRVRLVGKVRQARGSVRGSPEGGWGWNVEATSLEKLFVTSKIAWMTMFWMRLGLDTTFLQDDADLKVEFSTLLLDARGREWNFSPAAAIPPFTLIWIFKQIF